MILPAACILYTHDPHLVRRTRSFLRSLTPVRHVDQADRLNAAFEQDSPALLLLDLRSRESRDLLEQVQAEWPKVLIVGFGMLRSEPLRDAEQAGIYAAEDVDLERRHFQTLVSRALDHLRVLEDNRALRADATRVPLLSSGRAIEPAEEFSGRAPPISRFSPAVRRFENMEMLVNSVVEGLADTAMVTRVGMFLPPPPGRRLSLDRWVALFARELRTRISRARSLGAVA